MHEDGDAPLATDATDKMYSAAEVLEKLAEIQSDLKLQITSFRKPPPYTQDRDLRLYLEDFNSYRQVVSLPKRINYQIFVSYLPDNLKKHLRSLDLSEAAIENWDGLQTVLLRTLVPPMAKVQA